LPLTRKKKTSSPLPIIGAESVSSLAAEGITADCSQRPERKEVTFGTRRQALELHDRETGDATVKPREPEVSLVCDEDQSSGILDRK